MFVSACTMITILVQYDRPPITMRPDDMTNLVKASKPIRACTVRARSVTGSHSIRKGRPDTRRSSTLIRAQVPEQRTRLGGECIDVSLVFLFVLLFAASWYRQVQPGQCFDADDILQGCKLRACAYVRVRESERESDSAQAKKDTRENGTCR